MTTINDREWAFLAEATGEPGPFNDMYFKYLRGLGYTGTLQDMIAKNGGGLTPSKGVSYDPAASALFARFTTPPTSARKTLINDLIVSLKDAGVWGGLDALYVTAAADAQSARQNWIADQFNLTPVSAPTFTADRGYQGDGVASYLTTGFTPGGGSLFALNSAHMALWSRTNSAATTVPIGARTSGSAGQSLVQPNISSGNFNARINQDVTSLSASIASTAGFLAANRSAAGAMEYYRNGASIGTGSEASTSLPNVPFFFGALNSAGSPAALDARQLAAGSLGASLTSQQHANYHTALATYMQAVGAA